MRDTVDDITEAVSSQVKNIKPPASMAEAVTAEGVRVHVKVADDALTATQMEARAAKDVSGRRSLEAHEAKANAPELKGHTIEQHVGKSENWLRNRLESDPTLKKQNFASSFFNEAAANKAQGRFAKRYKAEIDAWLKSGSEEPLKVTADIGEPIGIVVQRGKGGHVVADKAFFMLIRDSSPHGWHVLTSYAVK